MSTDEVCNAASSLFSPGGIRRCSLDTVLQTEDVMELSADVVDETNPRRYKQRQFSISFVPLAAVVPEETEVGGGELVHSNASLEIQSLLSRISTLHEDLKEAQDRLRIEQLKVQCLQEAVAIKEAEIRKMKRHPRAIDDSQPPQHQQQLQRQHSTLGSAAFPTDPNLKWDDDKAFLLQVAVSTTQEGIVMSDMRLPDQPLVFINKGFEKMTGYGHHEIVGKNCRFLQGPDTSQEAIQDIRNAIKEMKAIRIELVNYRKDGTRFWNFLAMTPVFDTHGALTHYIGVQYDITSRKNLETALQQEQKRSDHLLLNILPKAIAEELKETSQVTVRQQDNVAILFADIVGFTDLTTKMRPAVLVNSLNEIFCRFDHLCDKFQVEKIKTIGDAYMVVANMPTRVPNPCKCAVDMAFAMLKEIKEIRIGDLVFNMRIGIHVGQVVAGVIGTKKLIFDVWGDSVNIASRMESHGLAGRVHVTEDLVNAVIHLNEYKIIPRGKITLKGRGNMLTFFLENKVSESQES
uniref:Putative LOV domain-containing protein n=1 Tax=Gloeochaete wittrockiana TaxID=38269 RepID=A0A126X0N1_9EUKA|nr:putative LOV domain-containing protein [Gloeochaete wittrockiana]|mmetsp:Transcript_22743/g.37439  ORF Transcript_22743/g.37439 Transcript_22743/m.37439 type:complete len:519 (+) Transcript_22743:112-1668(+)